MTDELAVTSIRNTAADRTTGTRTPGTRTPGAWTAVKERPGTVRTEWKLDGAGIASLGAASITVDCTRGARLTSLMVAGHELLTDAGVGVSTAFSDGCFAMVPYAGRVEAGRFAWRGLDHELPLSAAPHAAHGVTADVAWTMTGPGRFETDLDERWPFGGWARQEVLPLRSGLELALTVGNDDQEMPASIGFHPWFGSRVAGRRALLDWPAPLAYAEETPLITSRRLEPRPETSTWCAPASGPDPVIRWPGLLALTLSSDEARCWVVHEREGRALCVEPQTAPGNALRVGDAQVVAPGKPLTLRLHLGFDSAPGYYSEKEPTRAAA